MILLYNLAKIPAHFEHATFNDFRTNTEAQENASSDAFDFCENYEVGRRGMLFAGPTGVGKTHLAVAMVKDLVKYSVRCRFERVRDILEGYRHHYEHGELMASEYRAALCTVPVLVLDEIAPLSTEWQRTVISDIIEARYAARKIIIGTTNLVPAEIKDMFGECGKRVMSRLEEMTDVVIVTGPDARTTMTEGGNVETSS
jgi:DNA replication protein DnaC